MAVECGDQRQQEPGVQAHSNLHLQSTVLLSMRETSLSYQTNKNGDSKNLSVLPSVTQWQTLGVISEISSDPQVGVIAALSREEQNGAQRAKDAGGGYHSLGSLRAK